MAVCMKRWTVDTHQQWWDRVKHCLFLWMPPDIAEPCNYCQNPTRQKCTLVTPHNREQTQFHMNIIYIYSQLSSFRLVIHRKRHCQYSRTPLIRPPSESHWCGRIRGMVAREGFVYEQKPLSVTQNVVVWEGWSLVRVVVRQGFYCNNMCK